MSRKGFKERSRKPAKCWYCNREPVRLTNMVPLCAIDGPLYDEMCDKVAKVRTEVLDLLKKHDAVISDRGQIRVSKAGVSVHTPAFVEKPTFTFGTSARVTSGRQPKIFYPKKGEDATKTENTVPDAGS